MNTTKEERDLIREQVSRKIGSVSVEIDPAWLLGLIEDVDRVVEGKDRILANVKISA